MFDVDEFFQTKGVTLHLYGWGVHWERRTGRIVGVRYNEAGTGYDPITTHHFVERADDADAFAAIAKSWLETQPR